MITTAIPVQTTAPPEGNPDKVRITCPLMCAQHGWVEGNVYPTLEHDINVKDNNGFEVYVNSLLWNHPVWLCHKHYELLND